MSLETLLSPFIIIVNWLRSFSFSIGGFSITFWDLFVWEMFATIVIGFIIKVKNG